MRAACQILLAVVVVLGVTVPVATTASAASGVTSTPQVSDGVTCPAKVAGVPFDGGVQFAGTSRPLANDQGVLVRFTLLCPYAASEGADPAYTLNLAWSLYEADDLKCKEIEITSEPAGTGRIQGVLDDPTVSARVSYEGEASGLTAIDAAATQLLGDVPANAFPCEGGSATGVDAAVAAPPTGGEDEGGDLPTVALLGLAVVAGSAVLLIGGAMLASRLRRKKRAKAAAAPGTSIPGLEGLAALRRKPEVPAATQTPQEAWAKVATMDEQVRALTQEHDQATAAADRARAAFAGVGQGLARAREGVAMQRARTAAVRDLAVSYQSGQLTEYLASYAGVMTLALAGVNLVAAGAQQAADLVGPEANGSGPALATSVQAIDRMASRASAAAELALEDSRFWLWQDRRERATTVLSVLERAAPRQAVLQQQLTARVRALAPTVGAARRELDDAEAAEFQTGEALADLLDARNRQAATAQILEERLASSRS